MLRRPATSGASTARTAAPSPFADVLKAVLTLRIGGEAVHGGGAREQPRHVDHVDLRALVIDDSLNLRVECLAFLGIQLLPSLEDQRPGLLVVVERVGRVLLRVV